MAYFGLYRCKWLADGATNLTEMADQLEAAAHRLRAMQAEGVRLEAPVEDDYAELVTDDPSVAAKYDLQEPVGDDEVLDGGSYGQNNPGLVDDDDEK